MTATPRHFRRLLAAGVVSTAMLGGCTLPDSHLPAGFSSSYYRALQATQPMPAPGLVGAGAVEIPNETGRLRVWNPLRPPGQ